ncbi:MAG: CPBP family intramembrane glutamic endopeptidase [Candidatus Sulfotelmatobacter sp.]
MTLTEPIPPTQPSALRKIFIGKDGLRAGWSLLIFIPLFFAGVIFWTSVGSHKLLPPPVLRCIPFLVTLLVTWIMSKIERRPNSVYGLGGSRKLPYFFAGLAWGLTCLSLLVLTLWKAGLLVFESRLLFGSDILRYGAIGLLGFLLVGLFEEYLTRGYLQYTLTRGLAGLYQWAFKARHSAVLGFWTAAVLMSFLFGLGHGNNPGESPIGLLSAGLAAMVFCFSLWRTGSLWWAIGFHASWDWGQSFLYGVPDSGGMFPHHLLATHPVGKPILSGGTTGPEGSIFIVAVLALASLIILFTLRGTHFGDTPQRSTIRFFRQ